MFPKGHVYRRLAVQQTSSFSKFFSKQTKNIRVIIQPVSNSAHFEITAHLFEVGIKLMVVKMAFYVEHLNFTLSSETERSVIHQTVAKVLDRKVCIFGHPDVDLRCDKFFWAEGYTFWPLPRKKVIRGV